MEMVNLGALNHMGTGDLNNRMQPKSREQAACSDVNVSVLSTAVSFFPVQVKDMKKVAEARSRQSRGRGPPGCG